MHEKRNALMLKMIKSSLFVSSDEGETMNILVPVQVPVEWVQLIKKRCTFTGSDFPQILDAILIDFFTDGMISFMNDLKKEYESPRDIVKDFMGVL